MKILYRISLNNSNPAQPAWRLMDPSGRTIYADEIKIKCHSWTYAEPIFNGYKGWLMAEGTLTVDETTKIAVLL